MLYSTFVARVKEKILDSTIFRLAENQTFAIALAKEAKSYSKFILIPVEKPAKINLQRIGFPTMNPRMGGEG